VSVTEFQRKADFALEAAKRDLGAGDFDGAANRLYYAMFHAARAALLSIGQPAQGRHRTIIAQFGRHFCRNGPLPAELGRAINEAQELRIEVDYNATTPDGAEVTFYIATAEQIISRSSPAPSD
jgi:uncharacterized protein (UPF0332 family)